MVCHFKGKGKIASKGCHARLRYKVINRLTAVDAYMRKSEGPSQNKS